MTPSNLKAAIGVGALAGALFLTGIGSPTLPGAFAQDATPATPAAAGGESAAGAATDPRMQAMTERYDAFLGKMGTELGATNEEVDAAIRASLKGMIDDAVTAGDLAANDATALKERIDAAEIPLFGMAGRGIGGPGERGGHDDRPDFGEHRGQGERDGWDDDRKDADRTADDAENNDAEAETQSTSGALIDAMAPVI